MAGYSGTPLFQKLGIKDGFRVLVAKIPADVHSELKEVLSACKIARKGPLDFAMAFVKTQVELKAQFARLAAELAPTGMLWVSWPKKSSGVVIDFNEHDVRKFGLDSGLVDVKVCAVNDVWSGLKFVIRVKDRKKT